MFLIFSTDESATEGILKSMQIFASLCGQIEMNIPRDAFITALCKASLPPHYTLTVLNSQTPVTPSLGQKGKFYYSPPFEKKGVFNSNFLLPRHFLFRAFLKNCEALCYKTSWWKASALMCISLTRVGFLICLGVTVL